LHTELNGHCPGDLIDMPTQYDRENKLIMVYQDHLTKFALFRALETKSAEDIAYHLNGISLTSVKAMLSLPLKN
jgi:hypothetical protein